MPPPQAPGELKTSSAPSKPKCFRIRDVPKGWSEANLRQALETLDPALRNQQYKLSLYPACFGTGQVGILKIPNCTEYFSQILPYERFSRPVQDEYLTIDCDFDGFTPFNKPQEIYADVVAVTGLAGHAYGSWRSRESGRMWLQDFLPDDIPSIRIMSFGYDSRIDANKETDRMLDYARSFLSQLYNVRSSKEVWSHILLS
ncbi:hypothetical protein CPB86DRAFT_836596 [Serendipita vermifera]|nr:hypothetical protein CPB86DRAFT_836596 [Serendipita vermifera]